MPGINTFNFIFTDDLFYNSLSISNFHAKYDFTDFPMSCHLGSYEPNKYALISLPELNIIKIRSLTSAIIS